MTDTPDWLTLACERIVKVLHKYPNGLTRDEIRRKLGYRSKGQVSEAVQRLIREEKVRILPRFSIHPEKVKLIPQPEEAAS